MPAPLRRVEPGAAAVPTAVDAAYLDKPAARRSLKQRALEVLPGFGHETAVVAERVRRRACVLAQAGGEEREPEGEDGQPPSCALADVADRGRVVTLERRLLSCDDRAVREGTTRLTPADEVLAALRAELR